MMPVAALALVVSGVSGTEAPEALYRRIAADTAAGDPIVLTAYVALCDTASQGVVAGEHAGHCRGNARRDLYWSVESGARGFLDGNDDFERLAYEEAVSETIAARGVWTRTVELGAPLRALGAPARAQLLVVAIAYRGPAIGDAVRDFLRATASDHATLTTIGGRATRYGGRSHMIGFLGHDWFLDIAETESLYELTARAPAQPRAVFALSCLSDRYFRPAFHNHDTVHVLVLNRTFTYPSFFTVSGVLEGVLAGGSYETILDCAARRFAAAQKKPFAAIRAGLVGP